MRRVLIGLVLASLFGSLVSARQDEGNVARLYPLRHLDGVRAMLEVQAGYPESMRPGVEMRPEQTAEAAYLRVVAPPADQEAIARLLSQKDVAAPSVTLQVLLLEAMDASLPAPDLPGGASSALKDVRELFPFKGYRLRHTAVIPASRHGSASLGDEFMVRIDARPGTTGSIEVPSLELVKGNPHQGMTSLLGTSFTMRRGETVVLGTSLVPATAKVDPEVPRALVVLVTALQP